MKTCQIQDAKAHLSEYVHNLEKNGPVIITVHGRQTAAIISIKDFDQKFKPRETLLDFFARSPLRGLDLEIGPRDPRGGRPVDLSE
jgi:prevent-host-death family protein